MSKEEQTPDVEEQVESIVEQGDIEAGDDAASADSVEQGDLAAQVESLQEELVKTKDDALRMVAEAQNIKRRSEKDIENARKFALEKFAGELLDVADNLERALDAADSTNEVVKPLAEGVELTQKRLIDVLGKFNVEQLNPVGEPFDPQFHQAMSYVESPDAEPNSVTLVMQKGYTLNGRLLRPAMVMIAKAPAASIDEQA
jgi:molecular chaperone GrpE